MSELYERIAWDAIIEELQRKGYFIKKEKRGNVHSLYFADGANATLQYEVMGMNIQSHITCNETARILVWENMNQICFECGEIFGRRFIATHYICTMVENPTVMNLPSFHVLLEVRGRGLRFVVTKVL